MKGNGLRSSNCLNYQLTLKGAERAYRKADADDKKVISGMKSDCEFVIEWLSTGRRPGNKRGIERRAVYQREILMDPIRMQSFIQQSNAGSPSNLSEWQRFQIEDALSTLSPREKECYVLAFGNCYSRSQIAHLLGIKKESVNEYIARGQVEIGKSHQNSLFLCD
ncbi:sigma factor-like helix-turn-helix DNA-binding protein [Paenibacillus sp. FSL H7-0714]|uniref:sigma factor-like helix-turn-helix DNA-binding protein n=1 Tax=Paenibacillus sp. FSL H7-0714 TaxID=2954735 RepID=UPI0030F8E5E5